VQFAPLRHGLHGVQAQVEEHLLREVGIRVHQRDLLGHLGEVLEERHLRVSQLQIQQVQRLLQHLAQVARLRAGRGRTGEHEQAGDDLLDAVQLLDDVLEILAPGVVGLELRAHVLDRGPDAGQRVADLVGHVGRQLAQRDQPVDVLLELAVLALGGGLHHHQRTQQGPVLVAQRQGLGLERQLAALGFDAELARLARGALQPARIGSGEQARGGQPQQPVRLDGEQLLDVAVAVGDAALTVERHHPLFQRVQDLRGPGDRTRHGLGIGRTDGGFVARAHQPSTSGIDDAG
jgi:hypothetical protein